MGTILTYKDGNGVAQPLIPAPLVTTSKSFSKTPTGENISAKYSINITGTILPSRGSPLSDGTFSSAPSDEGLVTDSDKFESIQRKQRAIRELFSKNGQELLIQSSDGSTVLKCYPSISSISFEEGVLVDKCKYTVTLSANEISTDTVDTEGIDAEFIGANLKSASDTFDLQQSDEDQEIFLLTRTISAIAGKVYSSETLDDSSWTSITNDYSGLEPWQRAKTWVDKRIGSEAYDITDGLKDSISDYTVTGLDIGTGDAQYRVYSRRNSENADRIGGSYSLTRTWALSKNEITAIETYDISVSSDSPNQGGAEGVSIARGYNTIYSIRGNIQGLENETYTKYENATTFYKTKVIDSASTGSSRWTSLLARITASPLMGGVNFTRPFSQSISENKKNGSVTYEFQFKEWSLSNAFFADMSLVISESHDEQVIASIPIPGRTNGPIIQNINTTNLKTKSINGTFVLYPGGNYTADGLGLWKMSEIGTIRGEVIDVLDSQPYNILTGDQGTDWWVTSWSDNLDPLKGVYSTTMTITYKGIAGAADLSDFQ